MKPDTKHTASLHHYKQILLDLVKPSIDDDIRMQLQIAVDEFNSYLTGDRYFNRRKYDVWKEKYTAYGENINLRVKRYVYKVRKKSPEKVLLGSFFRFYRNGDKVIDAYNRQFVAGELSACSTFFDTIEKYPLDKRQQEAVVHDEDRNLIIAGAGTGKTTTIVGKYAYLIERLQTDPETILLLAFTEKAAAEMRVRIQERMKAVLDKEVEINAKTFHSLGLGILTEVFDYKPDLVFDSEVKLRTFMQEVYEELTADEQYRNYFIDYLVEYLKPYKPPEAFSSKGEYIEYIRANNIISLKREELKSYEEVEIANFLFLHNIDYKYEEPYKYKTRSREFRQYKPDFYLPEYDIYIEHWGVDKNGSVPDWFGSTRDETATDAYLSKMEWAKSLHKQYNTKLIETHSYEKKSGVLIKNLKEKLKRHGVRIERKSDAEILEHFEDAKEIPLLINLILTFLNLYKSNMYTDRDVLDRMPKDQQERTASFLRIFKPFYERYEQYLQEHESIDFNDMIAKAAQYVRENKFIHRYAYILIDEFQDISSGRYRFVKALLDQSPDTKLFCVGDDWQSIYRFTGSDVTIMTNFEKYFGYAHKIVLNKTYRFNDKILRVSSDFVQKNPSQIKKKLKTDYIARENPIEIIYTDMKAEESELLKICIAFDKQAERRNKTSSLFIISRYNFNKPDNIEEIQKACPNLTIEAITAHKSKGLEADYAILKSVVSGIVGFPCGMTDDPIITSLLSEPERYEHAEERRLFYVAMTRARDKMVILSSNIKPSPFIRELDPAGLSNKPCPDCLTGVMVKKSGKKGDFMGCTNYPYCRYTVNVVRDY
jgi:DNA helicase IV